MDSLPIQGQFIAELKNPKTGLVSVRKESPNLITKVGKNLIARFLLGVYGFDTGLTYQAIGTGTDAPLPNDTGLDEESARRKISVRQDTWGKTAAFFSFFPSAVVPNQIAEVGIFGHSTATDTADSGILFARTLLSITNSAGEDLTLTYVLTVG